jgi:multimeric flavodoxin WrbA
MENQTMKIIGIAASPRAKESQTLRLVQAVLDGACAAGAVTECVDLCELKIEYCASCRVCYAKGRCVHKDDFDALYGKMLASDGIVWGSPNYFSSVSAQMKTFIDRMSDGVHCQVFTGKYGCTVASAGGPNHAEATDYMNRLLVTFGASVVGAAGGSMSIAGSMDAAESEARKLGQALVAAIETKRAYPEQEAAHAEIRARFKHLVTMNEKAWPHEYEHWLNKGWL